MYPLGNFYNVRKNPKVRLSVKDRILSDMSRHDVPTSRFSAITIIGILMIQKNWKFQIHLVWDS